MSVDSVTVVVEVPFVVGVVMRVEVCCVACMDVVVVVDGVEIEVEAEELDELGIMNEVVVDD